MKNENFEQSQSPEKSEGRPFGIFKHLLCSKIEGRTLWYNQKVLEKSYSAETIRVKNIKIANVGILSCFRDSGRWFFNFG